uniref:Uncharacterized protein n=1 Tax=Petalonia binghamiae TaxID=698476 RepID=A0A3Q8QZN6_9PHAE|nr:hypothetical protein Pbin_034 [Endarachne binghamiae]
MNLKWFLSIKNVYVVICTCTLSFFFMVLISPIISVFILLVSTIFLSCKNNYKDIFMIWGFFFFTWYFLFTACMLGFDSPIWIGGEYSRLILEYLVINTSNYSGPIRWYTFMLENFCIQSVVLLDLISNKLGFSLYVPSLLKGLLILCKSILGKGGGSSPKCSPEKGSKFFSSKVVKESKTYPVKTDVLDSCAEIRDSIRRTRGYFDLYNGGNRISGNCHISYLEVSIPFYQNLSLCFSRNATKEELANNKKK